MEYRIHKRTGDRISVIGLGTSYIAEASEKEAVDALLLAYENGINYGIWPPPELRPSNIMERPLQI